MWNAYYRVAIASPLDWIIWMLGVGLILAHITGLLLRYRGKQFLFVQNLHRYQAFCLLLTDLLPVLGLLGTALGLLHTFDVFNHERGQQIELAQLVQSFSPALSTTISGLLWALPNLLFNAILWLSCRPDQEV